MKKKVVRTAAVLVIFASFTSFTSPDKTANANPKGTYVAQVK
ncbi:MAG: hypothetical protein SFW35_05580 [Chitinophagales bacterium]|nr:hypothetical protein [Chitinophagales bacterium]